MLGDSLKRYNEIVAELAEKYWKKEEDMSKMPKLTPGMVVEYTDNLRDTNMGLVIDATDVRILCYEIEENPDQELTIVGAECISPEDVRAVYKCQPNDPSLLSSSELYEIVTHHGKRWQIWFRPTVREMTVKEIEEKLGYKITIVGQEVE